MELTEEFFLNLGTYLLTGRPATLLAALCLVAAVYIFIRWKQFALSFIFLSVAFFVAYAGGFMLIIRSLR